MNHDIQLLDSIPKFNIYSKCGSSIERKFHFNSLKHLIHSLKFENTPKKLKKPEKFIDEDIDIFDIIETKKENNKNTKHKTKTFKQISMINQKINSEMSPCKYNPNYNSIYKKIPYVKIISPEPIKKNRVILSPLSNNDLKTEKSIILKNDKTEFTPEKNSNNNSKNNSYNKSKNSKNEYNNDNENNKTEEKNEKNIINSPKKKLPEINKNNKNNKNYFSSDKSNHALRFSQYNDRKTNLPNLNLPISYIEPHNYTKKRKINGINFNKMKKRPPLINKASLDVPNPCQYQPKYTVTDKNIGRVNLSKNPVISKKDYRKYLIKKVCSSYYVDDTYHLIDNSLLKNNV